MRSFPGNIMYSRILKPNKAVCGWINGLAESRATSARLATESGGSLQCAMRGRQLSFVRCIYRSDHRLQLTLLVFMLLWYSALLWISWRLSMVDSLRLTFNSMLDHRLRGQFDVDPQVVMLENYLRNGHVYSYFGVWCAPLRIPLWMIGRPKADMTFWSCIAAVCLAGMAKVRAVILIRRRALGDYRSQFTSHLHSTITRDLGSHP
jgi:hypothetical protein